jgi:hypothetical protein
LQGLSCVVQPVFWLECSEFAGGFATAHQPPYPVEAFRASADLFIAFLTRVVHALVSFHQRGIAHGDLKPDVFRTDDGHAEVPASTDPAPPLRMIDFNLSLPAATALECPPEDDDWWGTLPFSLRHWVPMHGAAIDCVALSSLLAHWLELPTISEDFIGTSFPFRARTIRDVLDRWRSTDPSSAPPERAWHLKVLALQLMLMERCNEHSLEAIWDTWYHVFWLDGDSDHILGLPKLPTSYCVKTATSTPVQTREFALELYRDVARVLQPESAACDDVAEARPDPTVPIWQCARADCAASETQGVDCTATTVLPKRSPTRPRRRGRRVRRAEHVATDTADDRVRRVDMCFQRVYVYTRHACGHTQHRVCDTHVCDRAC